jgi:hypothetical protein
MDLAGNAEDCALPPENYKPCNLASALLRLGHGLSPRILRHATSPPLRFGSVTGCRPIKKLKNKFSYVSELPTKFVFTFFAWLVVFVKKVLALWKKVW